MCGCVGCCCMGDFQTCGKGRQQEQVSHQNPTHIEMLWPHSCCIKTRTKQGRRKRKRRTLCIHQVGHGLVGNVHVQRAHATTTITSAERYAMRRYYIMRCTHTQESCDIPSCSLYSFSFDLFLFFGLISFSDQISKGGRRRKKARSPGRDNKLATKTRISHFINILHREILWLSCCGNRAKTIIWQHANKRPPF